MDDKTKNDFIFYVGSEIALARAKDDPYLTFILSENENFNFEDLIELSELIKEKFPLTWVLFDMKNKHIRVRVVLK